MHWNDRRSGLRGRLLIALIAAAALCFCVPEGSLVRGIYGQYCPCAAFCMNALAYGEQGLTAQGRLIDLISRELPLYRYSISCYGGGMMSEYYKEYVEILLKEEESISGQAGNDISSQGTDGNASAQGQETGNTGIGDAAGKSGGQAKEAENGAQSREGISGNRILETDGHEGKAQENASGFLITDGADSGRDAYQELIHTAKQQDISAEDYAEFEELIGRFYTVDSSTYITAQELNASKLAAADMRLAKNDGAEQILIYHTHSQEGYADSVPGDASTTVVGVGEELARILEEEYGYRVLHHTGQYDLQARDYAYSYALPAIEQILKENPSIEVVIDLHRDSVSDENKLVTRINGVETARFMFFNGLSRVREVGEISYLPNENLQDNLAFSFQMQKACEEYYPGLARKIYLKGYRYNMHVKPRTLLIELGAQNNTLQEAMNACGPLARALDLVLSGKN